MCCRVGILPPILKLFPVSGLSAPSVSSTFPHLSWWTSSERSDCGLCWSYIDSHALLLFSQKQSQPTNSSLGGNETEQSMKKSTFALIYGSIIAVGLPLSAVSLWILLCHYGSKLSSAVFMINLVILVGVNVPEIVGFSRYLSNQTSFKFDTKNSSALDGTL